VGLYEELCALAQALDDAGVEYALYGGLALAIHGVPRETRGIDLLAHTGDLARIREVALQRGFTVEVLMAPLCEGGLAFQQFTKHAVSSDGSELMLDILLIDEQLDFVWNSRTRVEFEHGSVSVVSRTGLICMKIKAGRQQDLDDIQELEALDV
jgi:hypothetical protein